MINNKLKRFWRFYKICTYMTVELLKKLGSILDKETPNELILTKSEYVNCLSVAVNRFSCNTWAKRISHRTTQFENICNGTCSEYIVAKWLGCHWEWNPEQTKPDTDLGDLPGTRIQIRMSDVETGHLIVKESDPDNHVYVFLVGTTLTKDPPFTFKVVGWKVGSECKQEKFRRDNAYWVNQENLNPPIKSAVMAFMK